MVPSEAPPTGLSPVQACPEGGPEGGPLGAPGG
jgi:hypothetical protein